MNNLKRGFLLEEGEGSSVVVVFGRYILPLLLLCGAGVEYKGMI